MTLKGELYNIRSMKIFGKELHPGPIDYIMAVGALVNLVVIVGIILYYIYS